MNESATNGELINRVKGLRLDGALAAGKNSRGGGPVWLPWVLCTVLALAWAGVGIRSYKKPPESSDTAALGPAVAGENNTAKANNKAADNPGTPGTIQLEVKGYLVPAQQIAVSPIDVGGRVVELNVVEGKLFKKGDVLAKLEDISYQAAVEEAKAALAGARGRVEANKMRKAMVMPDSVRKIELDQARAELKEAEAQQARALDLLNRLEKVAGGASEQEIRQARFDNLAAEARVRRLAASFELLTDGPRLEQKKALDADVQTAEAELKAAEARLTSAMWRLENCIIRAPIDGTVLSKKAELGNLVNPMAFSSSTSGGGAVCDLANLADLEADLEIPERDISKLKVGQLCRVRADAFPERIYDARLDRIMPIANRAKSIVNVRVKITLPAGEVPGTYLKPEMGAVVSFLAQ
jgi:HlyD family secretion protein